MCSKKACGIVLLVVGILFLLQDLGKWAFWGLNWWTVVILLAGICHICKSCCPKCSGGSCAAPAKKKRKRR